MKRGPWPQWGRVSPDEQILAILRQAEGGMPVAELCRAHGMTPLPGNGLPANHERERVVL